MRLIDIQENTAEQQRVKRLADNAGAAKNKADQMQVQADSAAKQLSGKQSKRKTARPDNSGVISTIKPHS